MIERIENALQIAVLLVCTGFALARAFRFRDKAWILLSLFYSSWALGDIYWTVCLLFYGQTPAVSVISDLSWYASYIFLYMLLREADPPDSLPKKQILPWLGPLFAAAMAVFFIRWGEFLSNLIYAALLGLLLFSVCRRLDARRKGPGLGLCVVILVFCLLEYALWTASCIWEGKTLANPYFWFDFLLTLSFIFFLPAMKSRRRDTA